MLSIVIPASEGFDSANQTFINLPEVKLQLEHSLISISKWESKYHKPFLSSEKSNEEVYDYICCMSVGKEIDIDTAKRINYSDLEKVKKYIDDPMTATTFHENGIKKKSRNNKEIITNELIYYWMAGNQVPFECEKWHLNRLLTLLEVFAVKNDTNNKMSKRETLQHNAKLNAIRRASIKKSK